MRTMMIFFGFGLCRGFGSMLVAICVARVRNWVPRTSWLIVESSRLQWPVWNQAVVYWKVRPLRCW